MLLTYDDFLACGEDEQKKTEFILSAINQHINSTEYKKAMEAQKYYDGENPTINNYEKLLYDIQGKAHVDMWTANNKIASQFFTIAVNQGVAYLLGNGVRFSKKETKKKLGATFDIAVMRCAKYAMIAGQAFGFWNHDHLDVFKLKEFKPIYDAKTGAIMLGIRFWKLADDMPLNVTLYELDGYTEYIQKKDSAEPLTISQEKRPYVQIIHRTPAEGITNVEWRNYDGFPIVPLYANEEHKSTLNGKRNTIDALDISRSGMVNNVSEGDLIYWVLSNAGGMDDFDDQRFLDRLKKTHIAHADTDSGATVTPHSVAAPVDGTKVAVEDLRNTLYEDFQAFDPKAVTAGNQSATAVKAAYANLDLKCDIDIEPQVTEFILGILRLAGIDDAPTYQRNPVSNKLEEIQTLTMMGEYVDAEYMLKKMLTIQGDIDMYEEISKRMDAENANRLKEAEARLKELEARNERGNSTDNLGSNDTGTA